LLARYGEGGIERTRAFFAARGLDYNPNPDVVPNSLGALRLAELARTHALHGALHERLMDAYWADARDIGDDDVLRELGREVGLPDDEVDDVLAGDQFGDLVRESTVQATAIGVNGVPAFLLDRRLLVLGAQPDVVFEQAFEQLEA